MTEFIDNDRISKEIHFDEEYGLYHRGPGDVTIIKEQPRAYSSFSRLAIAAGGPILDLGGHIGTFVRFMRDRGFKGKILSIEPDPNNIRVFKKNCPTEELFEGAVTNGRKRKGNLYLAPRSPAANTLIKHGRKKDTVEVALISWATLLKKWKWTAIKCDIQGAEYTLDWSLLPDSVRTIALEYHFHLEEWGAEFKRIHKLILGMGFETQRKPSLRTHFPNFSEAIYKRS